MSTAHDRQANKKVTFVDLVNEEGDESRTSGEVASKEEDGEVAPPKDWIIVFTPDNASEQMKPLIHDVIESAKANRSRSADGALCVITYSAFGFGVAAYSNSEFSCDDASEGLEEYKSYASSFVSAHLHAFNIILNADDSAVIISFSPLEELPRRELPDRKSKLQEAKEYTKKNQTIEDFQRWQLPHAMKKPFKRRGSDRSAFGVCIVYSNDPEYWLNRDESNSKQRFPDCARAIEVDDVLRTANQKFEGSVFNMLTSYAKGEHE
ncbi:MAG: hypothetical protein ABW189_08320 [Rickettsiales bacterium]